MSIIFNSNVINVQKTEKYMKWGRLRHALCAEAAQSLREILSDCEAERSKSSTKDRESAKRG